jgi:flagellar assembly factor FliW
MVYPGANSSIRFEKLREGIIDFEKIRIIRLLASKSDNAAIKKSIQEFEAHLKTFIDNPDYSKRDYSLEKITQQVHKGKKMLEELSNKLGN